LDAYAAGLFDGPFIRWADRRSNDKTTASLLPVEDAQTGNAAERIVTS